MTMTLFTDSANLNKYSYFVLSALQGLSQVAASLVNQRSWSLEMHYEKLPPGGLL